MFKSKIIFGYFSLLLSIFDDTKAGDICGQSAVLMPFGNGTLPSRAADFPWLARLTISGKPMCTASLISNRWLISAARCFIGNNSEVIFPGDVVVILGDINTSQKEPGEVAVAVDKIVVHPNFDEISSTNDFALLHLSEPLSFTENIHPICLIEDCVEENPPGSICAISGWASDRTLFNAGSPPLVTMRKSNVPLVDRETCRRTLSQKPDTGEISFGDFKTCVGYEQGYVDDCRGDTGGPLSCRSVSDNAFYLHGVNSFGYGCLRPPGYYHIYSRPCAVMPWIREVTAMGLSWAGIPNLLPTIGNPEVSRIVDSRVSSTRSPSNGGQSSIRPAVMSAGLANNAQGLFDLDSTNQPGSQAGRAPNGNRGFFPPAGIPPNNILLQPAVMSAQIPRQAPRLLLSSDENILSNSTKCGANRYNMMAAGRVPVPRAALILEFPWQVRLSIGSFDSVTPFTCAGSFVEDFWVLTSARCLKDAEAEGLTTVTAHFGEYDLNKPTYNVRTVSVSKSVIHPLYDNNNYDYDFAMVKLSQRMTSSDAVKPICLLANCDSRPEDDKPADCLTVGWRTIANRKGDPTRAALEVVTVNVTSEFECNASLGFGEYTERKLCIRGVNTGGRPACQVDAGGPLMCKMANDNAYFLHGVASYTQRGCGNKDTSVIYGRPCTVAPWIQETVFNG